MTSTQHDNSDGAANEITFQGKKYNRVREGLADILNPRPVTQQAGQGGAPAKQSVFYNPIQQFNRDLTVLAIRAFAEDLAALRLVRHDRKLQKLAKGGGPRSSKKRKRHDGSDNPAAVDGVDGAQCAKKAAVPPRSMSEQQEISCPAGELDEGQSAAAPFEEASDHHSVEAPQSGVANADLGHRPDATVQKKEAEDTVEPPPKPPELDHSPPFRILDALSATGLRAIRYAKEISQVTSVTANDLLPSATASIRINVEYNGSAEKVRASTGDAKALMYEVATNHVRMRPYHVIDLDPYGTAAPFLDAAVQAVTDGGLLCVTCTDAGVYASVAWLEKTYSQYGGLPWKGPQCHEAGLRLILNAVATSAAPYGLAIEPLLSLNIDFYVRLFIRIKRSPAEVKCLASKTMVAYNCDHGCGAFSIQYLAHTREKEGKNGDKYHTHALAQGPTAIPRCEHCGFKTHVAGPMWGGPLHNPHFISRILNLLPSLDAKVYPTIPRIEGMLTLALNETLPEKAPASTAPSESASVDEPFPPLDPALRDPFPFFFNPSTLSRTLHCSRPSDAQLRGALIGLGYRATRSHTEPGSIRTDAPWHVIWEIMREWVRQKHPIKEGAITKGMAGWEILQKDRSKKGFNDAKQELRDAIEKADGVQGLTESVQAALYRIGAKTAGEERVDGEGEGVEDGGDDDGGEALKVVFDEKLGKEAAGKKMVRYQMNPRSCWGPMSKAKGGE
ncbi:MAG: hypothetical protein LQ345_004081 [Seirophora villosa]|nr:MAG: hypothetical protein LQ345_004081 [Seirophora villosa]